MILYLGNYLTKHGFIPTFNEQLVERLEEKYIVKKSSSQKYQLPRLLHMIYSILKFRKQTEIILIDVYSSRAFWYAYFCSRLAKWLKLSYITILRGGNMEWRLKKNPNAAKKIFLNSAENISPSKYLYNIFSEKRFPVKYIPNSLILKNYPFKKREKFELKLFYLRSLHKVYNPVLAVEVLKKLIDKYSEAELCFVGPNKDNSSAEIRKRAKQLGIEKHITVCGRLDKETWIKLSENYSFLINTTTIDNHPMSVIECMTLGLCVISTNAGGMPFLIDNNVDGVLVNQNDSEEFFNKISYIHEHADEGKKLTENARKKAEDFDWKKIKVEFFQVFESAKKMR